MKKKVAFALCAALMLCSMSVAALAAEPMTEADTVSTMISAADTLPGISAYPAEVRASEENGVYRLEKVYYLTAKDDPTTIPTADFEREGRTYALLDLLKNDQTETDTREHIEVVTLESKTKDMAKILKMLEPKLEVKTEDGYEGALSLDHTTIQVEAVGYGTSSRTVTAERTYPNLSDADVSLVPKSVNENGRTLTLADVSWQEAAVDPTDGYGIPIRYTAVASYTGTAISKYATGYTVTADYKGDITRTSCDTVVYTAVFPASVLRHRQRAELILTGCGCCSPWERRRWAAAAMPVIRAITTTLIRKEDTPHEKISDHAAGRLLYAGGSFHACIGIGVSL